MQGNDYIPKPFYPEELIAKIKERFKRRQPTLPSRITIGQTIFDRNLSTIEIDGTVQHLSARQSEILAILAQNIGQTVERATILQIVWGNDSYANSVAFNVQITYLRKAIHQATFKFLKDDTGAGLKVDAYYEPLNLVVEYMEIQHFKKGMFGNKYCPASGMHRDEQRAMYDQRRRDVLPAHGIKLVEIKYSDFRHDSKHKLLRNRKEDIEVIKRLLGCE